ncbi:transcription elongation factor A protein 3 isoform X2 [Lepisosteus oculatus]|uniref:Transcription elongation factor A (SII), 3 n=1 Tax=Lepisosteus oculatus TaxID=7918 RepID=W5M7R5_LEPOC|nr:PREDICTED: transcription elongation factor A protein 3-like isoform X2 [Lepisosteus oculatus]
MTREEELIRIAKKLDKMVSRNNMDGALDLLKELKGYNMNLKLLQVTRIGMSVNGVRKHCTDEEVVTLAKILIKNWKRLLESAGSQKGETQSGRDSETNSSNPVGAGLTPQPAKHSPDEEDRKQALDSKPSFEPPKKHTFSDQKKERKDSTDSKPPPPPPKHLPVEVRKESSGKDSTDSKSLPPNRSSLVTKKERQGSADAKTIPPKRPSLDVKKERKDSSDSKSAPPVKRPSTDAKPERRDSSDAKSNSSPKKLSIDIKRDRRDSLTSKPSNLSPLPRKPSTESRDERVNSSKGKPEPPKTPTSPTSPLSPSFSPLGGPFPPHLLTGDSIRDKCIEMLSAALRTDDNYKEYGTNCDSMAAEIEDHIYQEIKATDMKYKNRVRSRISNLKDPKNPELRRNVLRGAIELSRIASMTAEEMASDELKQLRNVLTQEAIREHQMAKTGGTATDLFQCAKCRKKNCTYNQVQTRSADEPMTTFVLCNECGNRWKFC